MEGIESVDVEVGVGGLGLVSSDPELLLQLLIAAFSKRLLAKILLSFPRVRGGATTDFPPKSDTKLIERM